MGPKELKQCIKEARGLNSRNTRLYKLMLKKMKKGGAKK